MASDDDLPTLKILLIGPSGAGKSACKSDPAAESHPRPPLLQLLPRPTSGSEKEHWLTVRLPVACSVDEVL